MDSSKLEFYRNSIDYILSVQETDGSIPWEKNKKLDPWDHIEAAMGLSIANKKSQAEKAFLWLKDKSIEPGSEKRQKIDSWMVSWAGQLS